jgi:hypothetical protein
VWRFLSENDASILKRVIKPNQRLVRDASGDAD